MVFEKNKESLKIGDRVKLLKDIEVLSGTMKAGSIGRITDCDQMRGYDFTDEEGNRVTECGFESFEKL